MITALLVVVAVLLVLAVTAAGASIRVLREYERGVVFRLGRLMDQRGPGLILLVPTIDRMVRVSLRTITLTIPPQETITRDNIPVRVTAVAYYRVVDPNSAVTQVEHFHNATLQIAQTTLRSVLGGADLDTLLGERERLNEDLQHVIDMQTEPWGIKVTTVEIKDVEIPERMQHAIARQAEAERERRAKIINAEGEFQAAGKLAEAADVIGRNPVTLQLRYLQTLREIGGQQNSTVVFPMPIDLFKPMIDAIGTSAAVRRDGEPARWRQRPRARRRRLGDEPEGTRCNRAGPLASSSPGQSIAQIPQIRRLCLRPRSHPTSPSALAAPVLSRRRAPRRIGSWAEVDRAPEVCGGAHVNRRVGMNRRVLGAACSRSTTARTPGAARSGSTRPGTSRHPRASCPASSTACWQRRGPQRPTSSGIRRAA